MLVPGRIDPVRSVGPRTRTTWIERAEPAHAIERRTHPDDAPADHGARHPRHHHLHHVEHRYDPHGVTARPRDVAATGHIDILA